MIEPVNSKVGSWFFRWRGYLLAPFGLFLIFFGKPTLQSFFMGLLIASLGEMIRIWGVGYTGIVTRKGTLDAPKLVTAGPYAYVRHPLYFGNALMGLGGTVMAIGGWLWPQDLVFFFLYVLSYGVVYGVLMPVEEAFLRVQFPESSDHYLSQVSRLFPRFSPYSKPSGSFSWSGSLSSEIHTILPFVLLVLVMAFKIRHVS